VLAVYKLNLRFCAVILLLLLPLMSQAALFDPCKSDGTLKSWSVKKGHSIELCSYPAGSSERMVDRNACKSDGALQGWATKAGYTAEICQHMTITALFDPCRANGTLKPWAVKREYSPERCSLPSDSLDRLVERNACKADGSLQGWVIKAGYASDMCSNEQLIAVAPSPVVTETPPEPIIESIPEPESTAVADPEPIIESIPEPESTAVADPEPIVESLPEPEPVVADIADPEPIVMSQPEPEPVAEVVPEPEPVAEVIPDPEPIDEVVAAGPKTIQLSWAAPVARMNGDPLFVSEIAGYQILIVAENSGNDQVINVDPASTSYTAASLVNDTYHFSIVAIDTQGLTSEMSDMVSVTVE